MNILVTNDDGVYADGLQALIRELCRVACVTVVAPDRERSAVGHSLTFFHPLRVNLIRKTKTLTLYSTDGSPTDCVLMGINHLMARPPDMVVSGINAGGNLGDDLTYSGTVAAAMEGAIHAIPSFAISLASFDGADFAPAAAFARVLARHIASSGLPPRTFLNVNVPSLPKDEIKGAAVTRQGHSIYRQRVDKRFDPRGHEYYWVYGDYPKGEPVEGTDFAALAAGKISISPLCLHFAAHCHDGEPRQWDSLRGLKF